MLLKCRSCHHTVLLRILPRFPISFRDEIRIMVKNFATHRQGSHHSFTWIIIRCTWQTEQPQKWSAGPTPTVPVLTTSVTLIFLLLFPHLPCCGHTGLLPDPQIYQALSRLRVFELVITSPRTVSPRYLLSSCPHLKVFAQKSPWCTDHPY